jgi:CspA family cold shock protein
VEDEEEGTVRWFDAVRGYGFIARDGAVDVFVHASEVDDGETLRAGQRVRFAVAEARRGLKARRVRLLTDRS